MNWKCFFFFAYPNSPWDTLGEWGHGPALGFKLAARIPAASRSLFCVSRMEIDGSNMVEAPINPFEDLMDHQGLGGARLGAVFSLCCE